VLTGALSDSNGRLHSDAGVSRRQRSSRMRTNNQSICRLYEPSRRCSRVGVALLLTDGRYNGASTPQRAKTRSKRGTAKIKRRPASVDARKTRGQWRVGTTYQPAPRGTADRCCRLAASEAGAVACDKFASASTRFGLSVNFGAGVRPTDRPCIRPLGLARPRYRPPRPLHNIDNTARSTTRINRSAAANILTLPRDEDLSCIRHRFINT